MICERCGAENKEGVRFCAACGKALKPEPIELNLDEIKIPAAARRARILKVSASKVSVASDAPANETEAENKTAPKTGDFIGTTDGLLQERESEQTDSAEEKAQTEQTAEDSGFIRFGTEQTPEQDSDRAQTAPAPDPTSEPMRIGNWVPVFILSAIPLVNLVMLFVWAFSSATNKSKQSYARTALIFSGIMLVLGVVGIVAYIAFFGGSTQVLSSFLHQ